MTTEPAQSWNARQYAANARYVSDLGMPLLSLLAPRAGERILDLGCGDGALTVKLIELGCTALGIDASADMVKAASSIGVDARVMDAQLLQFSTEFDAVFSNAALHWMKQPQAVIDGVWRALKPAGRFVAELGGHGNVATIVAALDRALGARGLRAESPWFFPRPDEYRSLMEAGGFEVESLELFPRPTVLPGDMGGWLETFAQHHLGVVAEAERAALIADVVNSLRAVLCDDNDVWRADYVRLRFAARKKDIR